MITLRGATLELFWLFIIHVQEIMNVKLIRENGFLKTEYYDRRWQLSVVRYVLSRPPTITSPKRSQESMHILRFPTE